MGTTSITLPPGPRLPGVLQTALFLGWPYPFVTRCQQRYGDIFTLRLAAPGQEVPGAIVYVADPPAIKELFSMDGRQGHAGISNAILGPLTGSNSILTLDRERHLQERRLIGPAFHGDAIERLGSIIREATERELASWADKGTFAVRPAMQRITFEVIMRAVLGVEDRLLQDRLLHAFEPVFNLSIVQLAALLPALRFDFGAWTPWGRFQGDLARLDAILLDLISKRRRSEPGDDILGVLLSTVDEEGNPLSEQHVRDELVTLLIAGHETTATALAWAFERLAHHPEVVSEVRADLAVGNEETLDAVAAETLRIRPVVMDVARQLSEEAEVGGFRLPAGTTVMPAIYLVHLDPKHHADPEAFRPSRFRDELPSRATWLPFGGGRRRCVGAAFAQMEMRIVLSLALSEFIPEATSPRGERSRLRGITFAPEHDARIRMRRQPLARNPNEGVAEACSAETECSASGES
jgi:cytochrome P450